MKIIKYFFIALALVILYSCVSKKKQAETVSKLESAERELFKKEEENRNLSLMIDSLRYEIEAIKTEYTNAQENIATLSESIENLQQQNASLEDEAVMVSETEPIVIYDNTVIQKTDTLLKTVREINGGNVGFYCPTEMYFDEPYDAYGLIADALSREDIKSMIKKSVLQHAQNAEATNFETDDFLIKPVDYYDKIELRLENVNPEAFEIKKIHSKDIRKQNEDHKNWHWKVIPKSSQANQQLLLKIIVYDNDGSEIEQFSQTYHFNVKVSPYRFLNNTKVLFSENPEWAWGSIIIPVVTFLFGRFQRRKKTEKTQVES